MLLCLLFYCQEQAFLIDAAIFLSSLYTEKDSKDKNACDKSSAFKHVKLQKNDDKFVLCELEKFPTYDHNIKKKSQFDNTNDAHYIDKAHKEGPILLEVCFQEHSIGMQISNRILAVPSLRSR